MSRNNKRVAVVATVERERALSVIQERKAALEPHVREEVKEATRALIDHYEKDLRELAKR